MLLEVKNNVTKNKLQVFYQMISFVCQRLCKFLVFYKYETVTAQRKMITSLV